jgi:RNA methyltransferase, TrmH family
VAPSGAGFHNVHVRAARALHLKKHRQLARCFLIDGPAAVEAALAATGVEVSRAFVDPAHAVAHAVADRARARGIEVLEVDERTMRSLSDTQTPQGVVAVAPFLHRDVRAIGAVLGRGDGPRVVLVLHEIADPGNAGTLIRAAQAFGACCVVFGPGGVDVYNEKLIRASMGAFFDIPILTFERWENFADAAGEYGLEIFAAQPGAPDVRSITVGRSCAVVVGHERHGLRGLPDDGSIKRIGIPQSASVDSLNAAIAGAIALYEISRATGALAAAARTNAP